VITATSHGLTSGDVVTISGHVGSTPAVDGSYTATVTGANTFTVPVNVTVAGTGGTVTAPTSIPTINGTRVVTYVSTTTFTIPVNVTQAGTGGAVTRAAVDLNGSRTVTYINADTFSVPVSMASSMTGGTVTKATSTPDINGLYGITKISSDTFSVPLTLTHGGLGGSALRPASDLNGSRVITSTGATTFTVPYTNNHADVGGTATKSTSTPDINGTRAVGNATTYTFTVPVNVTVGGVGGTATKTSPLNLRWTVKSDQKFDEDPPLVTLNSFVKSGIGASTVFRGNANYITDTLNALLGVNLTTTDDKAEILAMSELRWDGIDPGKTRWAPHTICNDIWKDTDTVVTTPSGGARFTTLESFFDLPNKQLLAAHSHADPALSVDRLIAGKNPAGTDRQLFTSMTHTGTPAYARNPAWADLDLTCFSPWNSYYGAQMGGVAISPRHVLLAEHFSGGTGTASVANGTTWRFVTRDNVIVNRTITNKLRVGVTDLCIALLDSDLPDTITPARVLPPDYANYSAPADYPAIYSDFEKKVHVRWLYDLGGFASLSADPLRSAWGEDVITGDSGSPMFIIFGRVPVLLGLFQTSTGGPSVSAQVANVNAVMTTLGGGYALTEADPQTIVTNRSVIGTQLYVTGNNPSYIDGNSASTLFSIYNSLGSALSLSSGGVVTNPVLSISQGAGPYAQFNGLYGVVNLSIGSNGSLTWADAAAKLTTRASLDSTGSTGINAQTGTSYTFVLGDAAKLVTASNAGAITLTVPPNASVAFAIGTRIHVRQLLTGLTSIAAGAGVTINSLSGLLALNGQYSGAQLIKTGTDTWSLEFSSPGGITAAGLALLDDASAAAQRTTLGAAASGANADITSISTGGTTRASFDSNGLTATAALRVGTFLYLQNGGATTVLFNAGGGVLQVVDATFAGGNALLIGANNTTTGTRIKRSGTGVQIRVGDDTADAALSAGAVTIGTGGTAIQKVLSAVKSAFDCPSIAASGGVQTTTLTVTGASTTSATSVSVPSGGLNDGVVIDAYVSAADTVTIKFTNTTVATIDPVSASYRVVILNF